MKKSKNKSLILIIFLVLLLGVVIYFYLNNSYSDAQTTVAETNTNIKEVTVGTGTITKTLTSSGEIASNLEETLELNTYRYLKEVYVEENSFVAEGANILKYTNGTYLTAPYDLVVTKINVPEVGYRCTSNNGITVQSTEEMTLSINIDETDVSLIKEGQEVEIVANAYEDKTYTGTVTKINQIGTYASNGSKFTGTVVFANDKNLKIGMSASCTIILEKAENVVQVPIEAVQTENNTKYVIVKNSDGTTKNITVETGLSNDAYVEIKSGLSGGETIQMIEETSTKNSTQRSGKGQMMDMVNSDKMPSEGGWQRPSGSGMQGMGG